MINSHKVGGLFRLGGRSGTSSQKRWHLRIVVLSDYNSLKPRKNEVEKKYFKILTVCIREKSNNVLEKWVCDFALPFYSVFYNFSIIYLHI